MAGKFEAYIDADLLFRFRLLDPAGTVLAVSGPFRDRQALAAGIAAVRECAGTGLVTDLCSAAAVVPPAGSSPAAQMQCESQPAPAGVHTFILAKGARRQGSAPRWRSAAAR